MNDDDAFVIRSYRVIFDLERRLHKIDRWRVPLPYGLPLRSLGYFVAGLFAVIVVGQLPIVGALLGVLHPAIRYLLLPIVVAYALTHWKIDGRLPHATAFAWVRMHTQPRRLAAFRAADPVGRAELGPVTLAPDERGARLRKGTITGPARIILRYPTRMRARRKTLHLAQDGTEPMWRGKQINLRADQRVVIE